MAFSFKLHKTGSQSGFHRARVGEIHTPHGIIHTPVFMPVGTLATVKSLAPEDLCELGAQIVLGNTYHLMLRPGTEVFDKMGGIHNFMKWSGPVLTDSGGFQIFSLPRSRKMTEEGAVFQSYVDGQTFHLSPEKSMQVQNSIGSDIMMVLDQCIDSTSDEATTKAAMELTHRWALRSKEEHQRIIQRNQDAGRPYQAAFAIVQGGVFPSLRKISADFLIQNDFDGFAIGGLAVGESKSEREDMTAVVTELLPENKPRYLMGVGTPVDLLEAVRRGVDMFDCIIPTKMAQQGNVYTSKGLLKLSQSAYKFSDEPLDVNCDCHTCRTHSRAYLHHLTKCREALGWTLLSFHNLYFYHRFMDSMREAIRMEKFEEFYHTTLANWQELDADRYNAREEAQLIHVKKANRGLLETDLPL